jgi:sterol desaturase/sphingolipid hydroxylase (fatty acid hydroxylase superfamily)
VLTAADLPAVAGLMLWLALNIVVLFLAERLAPYRDDWHPGPGDLKRDAGMLSLNIVADGVADVIVLAVAVMAATGTSDLPLVVQVAAGIVIAELGGYLMHRISHEGGWLWRVHVVHHLPAAVNAANSFNAHPVNGLYNKLARVAPLVLLGISPDAILIVALFALTQGMVVHANVRGRMGFLNWILGSAELHRLHHSVDHDQARNFGTTVPLWDQLLGTYRAPAPVARVGIAEAGSYPGATDLLALLRWPFAMIGRTRQPRTCCR